MKNNSKPVKTNTNQTLEEITDLRITPITQDLFLVVALINGEPSYFFATEEELSI